MIRSPGYLGAGGALLLAAGTWWLAQQGVEEPDYEPKPDSPDFYLENFTATTMGRDGKPDKSLSAERMIHYPADDSTELTQPRMTVFDKDRPPWRIQSETGWVSGDREIVLLNGEVKIDRSAAEGVRALHLTTSNLRVQPEQNYAETDEYVYAESDGSWVESTGMQTWFKKPMRIKLLAKVRGRYEVD